VRTEDGVLFAEINAPPMNLLGPELVRDLASVQLTVARVAGSALAIAGVVAVSLARLLHKQRQRLEAAHLRHCGHAFLIQHAAQFAAVVRNFLSHR
jgi:pimeloyl-ACP methyl ester carboxylesterase